MRKLKLVLSLPACTPRLFCAAAHIKPAPPPTACPLCAVGPNCYGIAQTNPGLAKYITGAIGFPFALLQVRPAAAGAHTPGHTAVSEQQRSEQQRWGLGPARPGERLFWHAGRRPSLLVSTTLPCPAALARVPRPPCSPPAAPGHPQIIVCGSELFTGNTALCFTALLEGKVKFSQVLKNWVSSTEKRCSSRAQRGAA